MTRPLINMNSFENPQSTHNETSPQELNIESSAEVTAMVSQESTRLKELLDRATGKSKALLRAFLLSTAIACTPAQAFDQDRMTESQHEDSTMIQSEVGGQIESTDSLDVLYRDDQFTWGVEYVPKEAGDSSFLAQHYIKINNVSGEKVVLGAYDNIFDAAKGVAENSEFPEKVRQHAQNDANVVQMERDFQASGLTEATGNPDAQTHIEERDFDGYGIKAKTIVEVDDAGEVVKLLRVSKIEGDNFSAGESGDLSESSAEAPGSDTELSDYERALFEQIKKQEADLLGK